MSAAFDFLLLYCSGSRAYSSSDFLIANFPRCLLCSLVSTLNSSVGLRRGGMNSPGYLQMSRYRPLRYLFGGYPIHQGKLNLRHPIYLSSGSSTSILTMVGVTMEGPEEVDSLSCFTSLVQSYRLMREALSGTDTVIDFRCFRNVLMYLYPESYPISLPGIIFSPQSIIPLYQSFCTSGMFIGI